MKIVGFEFKRWSCPSSGHFALWYGTSRTWVLYHEDDPRQALWESHDIKGCREWLARNMGEER